MNESLDLPLYSQGLIYPKLVDSPIIEIDPYTTNKIISLGSDAGYNIIFLPENPPIGYTVDFILSGSDVVISSSDNEFIIYAYIQEENSIARIAKKIVLINEEQNSLSAFTLCFDGKIWSTTSIGNLSRVSEYITQSVTPKKYYVMPTENKSENYLTVSLQDYKGAKLQDILVQDSTENKNVNISSGYTDNNGDLVMLFNILETGTYDLSVKYKYLGSHVVLNVPEAIVCSADNSIIESSKGAIAIEEKCTITITIKDANNNKYNNKSVALLSNYQDISDDKSMELYQRGNNTYYISEYKTTNNQGIVTFNFSSNVIHISDLFILNDTDDFVPNNTLQLTIKEFLNISTISGYVASYNANSYDTESKVWFSVYNTETSPAISSTNEWTLYANTITVVDNYLRFTDTAGIWLPFFPNEDNSYSIMFRYRFTSIKRDYICYIYSGNGLNFYVGGKNNVQGIINVGNTSYPVASSGAADSEWHTVAISITSDNYVNFIFDNESSTTQIAGINNNGSQKIATFGYQPWLQDYNPIDISDLVFYDSTLSINVMSNILGTFAE